MDKLKFPNFTIAFENILSFIKVLNKVGITVGSIFIVRVYGCYKTRATMITMQKIPLLFCNSVILFPDNNYTHFMIL